MRLLRVSTESVEPREAVVPWKGWPRLARRYLMAAAGLASVYLGVFAVGPADLVALLASATGTVAILDAVVPCLYLIVVPGYLASAWYLRPDAPHLPRSLDPILLAAVLGLILFTATYGGDPLGAALAFLSVLVVQSHHFLRLHDAGTAHAARLVRATGTPLPPDEIRDQVQLPPSGKPRPLQDSACSFCGSRAVKALVLMPDGAICHDCYRQGRRRSNRRMLRCALCSVRLTYDRSSIRNWMPRLSSPTAPLLYGAHGVACVRCGTAVGQYFALLPPLAEDEIATYEAPFEDDG